MVYLYKKRRMDVRPEPAIPLDDFREPQLQNEGQDQQYLLEDEPNSQARSKDQSDLPGKAYVGKKDHLTEFAGCPIDYLPEPAQEGRNVLSFENPSSCTSSDT